jgi:hypothetical protein
MTSTKARLPRMTSKSSSPRSSQSCTTVTWTCGTDRNPAWSPLEYGCHIRDVLLAQRERVLAARRANCAECAPLGREERVDHDGYGEQDPADVARQLADAAMLFGNVLARLGPEDWDRTVVYNYPEILERTLRWVAVHTVHDVQHHLLDIRRQIM